MVMPHQVQTVHHQCSATRCGVVSQKSALVWCGAKIIGTMVEGIKEFLRIISLTWREYVVRKYGYFVIPLSKH